MLMKAPQETNMSYGERRRSSTSLSIGYLKKFISSRQILVISVESNSKTSK